jgi:HEAT repeat protein
MRFLTVFFAATCLFGQAIPEKAWTALDQGIHDTNPLKRMQAVNAMAVLHPEARVTALLESALDDKVSGVREAACVVLGQVKARTSIPKLQAALKDKVNEVVFAAAKALYGMGDEFGRAVMEAILLGEQSDASGFVSSSVRDIKLKLHDPKQVLLLGAESGAGFLVPGGGAIGPVGEGLMKDKQASGQTVAALLLAADKTPESLDALRRALAEKNWTVRAAAARAVAMRDAATLYDDVAMLLADKKEEVQYSAAASLIRLKQPAGAWEGPVLEGAPSGAR